MKRLVLGLAGVVSLLAMTGCCCDWCNRCQTCCNPCGNPCASPCDSVPYGGAPVGVPAGAYVTPTYGAPATAAAMPVESLPTY
jgi:hypothetical protein